MKTPHDDPETDRDAALRQALAALPKDLSPPSSLEESVVNEMRTRGEIRRAGAPRRYLYAAAGLVAALAFFVAGFGIGTRTSKPGPAAPTSGESAERWILLLYEDDQYQAALPGQERGRVREYGDWARVLASRGSLVAGEKLNERGRLLARAEQEIQVSDGLPVASEGVVAGYFVVRAASLEEAISLASGCPHLKYGGRISLRRIES
jgi:hypothetical protein